jgi:hypothetical protein
MFMKASGLIAGGALVALLLAGCGGDNSASVSSATTSRGSATTSGASSASGTTTTPSFKGDKNSDFCDVAKDIASGDIANGLTADTSDMKSGIQKANDTLAKAKDSAPTEIKQDVATVADAFKKFSDLLAKYDYDLGKLSAAAQKDPQLQQQATDVLNDSKVEDANNRIVAYAEQVCGVTTPTS